MGYANPEIYYKGQKYSVGGNVGYRPAATGTVQVVKDLQFMSEVVERKRMSMSADELLHAMKMIVEVGPELVAEDGRPRGITGMIKFNRSFKGKLEAANSPWNDTCHCYIKPQLFSGATREITDARFINTNASLPVKVTNVTYAGATRGSFVVKGGKNIVVTGTNMLFVPTGCDDAAKLIVGNVSRDLTMVTSTASETVFAWPNGLTVNDGDVATLYLYSHAGVGDNGYSLNEKQVVCLAAEPSVMTITKITSDRGDNQYHAGEPLTITGTNFQDGSDLSILFRNTTGDVVERQFPDIEVTYVNSTTLTLATAPLVQGINAMEPMNVVITKEGYGTAKSPNAMYGEG